MTGGVSRGKVSIVTPVYNRAEEIARAIRSVRMQTYCDFEHLVIDDHSNDDTEEVVRSFASIDSRVKYIPNRRGKGAAGARNTGIEAATGRFIAFLDSDDLWLERKLEVQIQFMHVSGAVFAYGDYTKVSAVTREVMRQYRLPEHLTHDDLLVGCPIGCLTAAYDQAALGKRYMPSVRSGQDWALWLAITRSGTVARKYPGTEAVYTAQERSLSSNKIRKAADIYRVYREEERLSFARSLGYLVRHSVSAIVKD